MLIFANLWPSWWCDLGTSIGLLVSMNWAHNVPIYMPTWNIFWRSQPHPNLRYENTMKRLSDLALENNCTLVGNFIGADRIDFAEKIWCTSRVSLFFSRAWAAQEASKLSAAKSRFAGAFQPEDVVFYFEGWITQFLCHSGSPYGIPFGVRKAKFHRASLWWNIYF